jgi:2-amino-4-hydroxy-6-hydroxymethyldihydropteridine diphosphokinase
MEVNVYICILFLFWGKIKKYCILDGKDVMNEVFLSLGGNIGDRLENLRLSREALEQRCGKITGISGVYETAAWGSDSEHLYLNQVVRLKTHLDPASLMAVLLEIEQQLGRVRQAINSDRTADLDILFYGDLILHTPEVHVPHARLHLRNFVLIPLAEIAPGLIHPELQRTVKTLLENCQDKLSVRPVHALEN